MSIYQNMTHKFYWALEKMFVECKTLEFFRPLKQVRNNGYGNQYHYNVR